MKVIFVCLLIVLSRAGTCQEIGYDVKPAFEFLSRFPNVRDFTLASSGEEAYFTVQSLNGELSKIVTVRKAGSEWLDAEIVKFSNQYKYLEPFLSPDNRKLYFVSNRPLNDSLNEPKDYDIWFVVRENLEAEWSKPINLGKPVNTEFDEFYPSVAANGNLYFTRNSPDTKGEDDIFFSKFVDSSYAPAISLNESINSDGYEFNSYIAADESYLIYSRYNREDGLGSGDLYISFRNKAGNWTEAINCGPTINSNQMDYCPFVDEKNRTLYFTSKRSAVNSNGITDVETLVSEVNKYENGLSRIYMTPFGRVQAVVAPVRPPFKGANRIIPDGIQGKSEWKSSLKLSMDTGYNLFLSSDAEQFYVATLKTSAATTYTDIYVKAKTDYLNLHASMQLGERTLPKDGRWDDRSPAWKWGNNHEWTANRVVYKANANDEMPFHKQVRLFHGQEFSIAKEKLGPDFLMLVVIRDFTDPTFRISYPAGGKEHEPLTWQRVEMN